MKNSYCGMVLLLIVFCSVLNGCGSQYYYASYLATCNANDNQTTPALLGIAAAASARLRLPSRITVNRPGELAIVLDIGIIAGAPNYRPNSSGQIVFATVADNNSELSVVIIKEPKEEDAIVRNIRAVVEEEMRSHGCPTWVLDQTNTVKY